MQADNYLFYTEIVQRSKNGGILLAVYSVNHDADSIEAHISSEQWFPLAAVKMDETRAERALVTMPRNLVRDKGILACAITPEIGKRLREIDAPKKVREDEERVMLKPSSTKKPEKLGGVRF